jgi:hypothetical protein
MLIETEFSRDKHTFRSPAIIQVVTEAVEFLGNSPVHYLKQFQKNRVALLYPALCGTIQLGVGRGIRQRIQVD